MTIKTNRVWWFYHLIADSPSLRTLGARSFLGTSLPNLNLLCHLVSYYISFRNVSFSDGRSVLVVATLYFLGTQRTRTPATKVWSNINIATKVLSNKHCHKGYSHINIGQTEWMLSRYSLPLPRGCREGRFFRRIICRFSILTFLEVAVISVHLGLPRKSIFLAFFSEDIYDLLWENVKQGFGLKWHNLVGR